MTVEIGTEVAQFSEKENTGIFIAVYCTVVTFFSFL